MYHDTIRRLDWFSSEMAKKLEKNRDKRPGHQEIPLKDLLERLRNEVVELTEAMETGLGPQIIAEALDVANYAFFIADHHQTGVSQ